jgi:hypothetical protein
MNAAEIARALRGKWIGANWLCHCPNHEDKTPSLSIRDAEDGRRLLLYCHAGCSFIEVLSALKERGLPTEGASSYQPSAEERVRWKAEHETANRGRITAAQQLWSAADPLTSECPAGLYLISRGFPPPWPPTLRAYPQVRHPSGQMVPTLVAMVSCWPSPEPVAVQLTALTPDGQKADIEPLRWTRGVLKGAAVRMGTWEPGRRIVLTEGLEDALAVCRAADVKGSVAWAVLGVSGAHNIVMPERVSVVLAFDGDAAGRKAADKASRALKRQGHPVRVANIPDGEDPASMFGGGLLNE